MRNTWVATSIVCLLVVSALFGDFGQVFTYQGKLTDATGLPAESPVNMTFTLYTASTGGSAVWSKTVPGVDPEHGIFSVTLDISTGAPTSVNWDMYPELWLQVTVGTTELTPRERLTSAFHALNIANNAVSESKLKMTSHGTAGEDGYLLSFDNATGGFTWIDPSDVGGVNSIIGGDNIQVSSGTGNVTIDVAPQGAGSALDADLLDGQHGAYYLDADNINAGTLHTDRFSAYDDLVAESKIGSDADRVAAGDHSHTNMVTGTGTATRVAFWDGPNSLSSSANLYWNGTNSRLGIGTTTPDVPLDIQSTSGATGLRIRSHLVDAGSEAVLGFRMTTTASGNDYAQIKGIRTNDPANTASDLAFVTSDGTTLLERMRVTSTGNVGIGTVGPTSKLDVSGTGRFTDQVTIPETPTADAHAASKKYVDDQIATAGDDWGTQVVVSDATLDGTGITGSELKIAQQGATSGQTLKWNGTSWAPAADNVNDADADPTNEAQTLAGSGTADIVLSDVSGTGGGTITFAGTGGANVSRAGNTLTIDASGANTNEAPSNTYDFRGSIALAGPSTDTWQRGTEIQPKVDILVYQAFVCWGNEKFRIWRNSDAALLREVDLTGVAPGVWQTVDIFPPILLKSGENYTITCKNDPAGNNYAELLPSGPPDETYVDYIQGRTIAGTGFPPATPGFHPIVDIKFLPGGGGDNWGSQVVQTNARLTGAGTAASPLDIAQQGATNGQTLKWNGTSWAPAADNVNDADADPTNELQTIAGSGTSAFTLSGGGGTITLAGAGGVDITRVDNTLTIDASSAGDNLGNHTATENIQTSGNWLSNDGDNEGVYVSTAGNVGVGTSGPSERLDVDGSIRIRTTNNAPGDILTVSGTGVVQRRTPEEIRTDIGAAQDVNSVYYVEGNTSGSAGIWTGNIAGLTAYYDGLKIAYKIGIAGVSGGATLNLNGLGAVACRRNTGNLTTHLPAGTVVYLTYTTISGTGYWVWADYTDGTESYTVRWNNYLQAGAEITRYKIVMAGTDGKYYPLTIGNTTAATKVVASTEFRIESPIVSYYYNGTVAAGATSASYWYEGLTMSYLDYTLNQSAGFSAYMPLYLKGTINANGNFVLDGAGTANNDFWTQTLPSSEDGKVYIMIGIMNNTTTSMRLMVNKPIYEFKDGKLRLYTPEHDHELTNMDPYSIKGNPGGLTEPPVDIPLGENQVLGRQVGDIVGINIGMGVGEIAPGNHTHTGALTSTLQHGRIYIGDIDNVASEQTVYGDAVLAPDGQITITTGAVDGTNIALGGDAKGDIMYYDGTKWALLTGSTIDDYVLAYNTAIDEPYWKLDDTGGSIDGSGTPNKISKFVGTGTTIADSRVSDDGVNPVEVDADLTTTGNLTVEGNRITFGNLETIDNSTDGIVTITGDSRVTGHLGVNNMAPHGNYSINVDNTAVGGRAVNMITQAEGSSGAYSTAGGKSSNSAYSAVANQAFDGSSTNNKYGYQATMSAYADNAGQTVNNYGAYLVANGATGAGGVTNNYGLWASASGGNANIAGYFDGGIRLIGHFFDQAGSEGAPGQILASTPTGTQWIDASSGLVNDGTNGAVAYYSGTTTLSASAVGVTGQALISGSTGAPTWWAPTQGSVVFAGVGGILAEQRSAQEQFYWDNTNFRLGLGTEFPQARLDVNKNGTGIQEAMMIRNSNAAVVNQGASAVFAANRSGGTLTKIASVGGVITDIAVGAYKGALVFNTSDNAAPAERMRITHQGNVGIGVSDPGSYKLYVNGNAFVKTPITGTGTSTDGPAVSTNFLNGQSSMTGAGGLKIYTYLGNGGAASGGGGGSGSVSNGLAYAIAYYPAGGTNVDDLPHGQPGQILRSGGSVAAPSWSTPTYPNTATAGKILMGDGTNIVLSTPGFPLSAGPAGTILRSDGTNWAASTATYPNTVAQGDILYGSAANTIIALAKNTTATRYLSNTGASSSPAWAQVNLANGVTGTLPVANGGTGRTTLTTNGVLYGLGTGAVGMTAAGGDGQVLANLSGAPTWTAGGSSGQVLMKSASGLPTWTSISTGSGTVNPGNQYVLAYYPNASGGTVVDDLPAGLGASNQVLHGNASGAPTWGQVTSSDILDLTITNADIANNTINVAKMSASGTRDATTFLRGDNTWAVPGAGSVTGTGTNNYVAKWNGASSITNSQIIDNGTNVGIGTSPSAKLDVNGTVRIRGGSPAANKVLSSTNVSGDALWVPLTISSSFVYVYNSNADRCVNSGSWLSFSGCSGTIYLEAGQKILAWAQGGVMADNDCNGTSDNSYSNYDIRIAVNGNDFQNGAWIRGSVDNTSNVWKTNHMPFNGWSIAGQQTISSSGNYTFTLQARKNSGDNCIMGGDNSSSLQATMIILVLNP